MIDKIEILRRAKVRRAKLYHIREKAAKEISRQMRKVQTCEQWKQKKIQQTPVPETPAPELQHQPQQLQNNQTAFSVGFDFLEFFIIYST
jgi:hypothetical protein